ncbi:eukaryotic translation initiation factor 5B [Medicago truncatula]|nr:eukaryotic translation initiation factor 5B [Medicago truncatula]
MNEGDTVKPPPPSYRKPVSCIIGDAYTGKTMLLGCIRVVKESRICYFYCLSGSNTPLFTSLPTVNKLCRDLNMIFVHLCSSLMMIWTPTCNFHSLEAILKIMKTPQVNIPVSAVNIGPVHKKDVEKASAMLEKKPEYAVVLAFPAMVTPGAWQLAHKLGVKIFISDKMHHLFDRFKTYMNNIKEAQKKDSADEACVLKIKPNFVFNHKDPIVLGVDVLQGILK